VQNKIKKKMLLLVLKRLGDTMIEIGNGGGGGWSVGGGK
jgi:hypothetical protein